MKRTLLVFLLVNLMLSACAPVSAPTPTPAPSATPLPTATAAPTSTATPTSTPTATPTATPTPIPTIQVGNLSLPDPRVTNPELFDLRNPNAPIPQFVNAMKMAGIEITAEQVAQGITYKALKDKDGNPFVVAVYNLDSSLFPEKYRDLAGPIPLFIAKRGKEEWRWKEATLGEVGRVKGINVGNNIRQISQNKKPGYPNEPINSLVAKEFNLAILDEHFAFFYLEPERNHFTFGLADEELAIAEKAGMLTRGQALLYGRNNFQYTKWLKGMSFPQSEIQSIIKNHITNVMNHYKGRIDEWVVVNEVGDNDPYLTMFPDYVQFAFQTAEEIDPNAKLIYNFPISDLMSVHQAELDEFNRIAAKNKIFGIQSHIDGSNPVDKDTMIKVLKQYGVPIAITELDINMKDFRGSPEEKLLRQAQLYQTIVSAVLESGVCNSISFWESGDKFSWLEDMSRYTPGSRYSPDADGTLFFDDLTPKPSLYAVRLALLNQFLNVRNKSGLTR